MTRAAIARLGDILRSPTGFRGTLFWYEATRIAEAHASCRYRIGNLLPHLAKSVAMFGRWSPGRMPVRRVVSVRPNLTISKAVRLSSLRTEGCHLVGDFDDLLFSDRATGRPAWVARHAEGYVRALRAFDVFTVATSALAERLARKRPDAVVRVVRNGVSTPWLAAASDVSAWVEGDPLVIRYFSGSPSHDRDFATVADVLSDFLRAHPDVELEVIGPVSVDKTRFPAARFRHSPRLRQFDALPALLASSWLTIAPLEATEYNECKSAIKYLEAAAFGCPVIASPNADLRDHAREGAPVLLAESDADWRAHLERALDPVARARMGDAARRYVRSTATSVQSAIQWRNAMGALERSPDA